MEKLFHPHENGATFRGELLCGVTAFLTIAYILFVSSGLLAETGMPWQGVYVATVLVSAPCTVIFALFTTPPFGIAPGMGLNTFLTYTLCMSMGYLRALRDFRHVCHPTVLLVAALNYRYADRQKNLTVMVRTG